MNNNLLLVNLEELSEIFKELNDNNTIEKINDFLKENKDIIEEPKENKNIIKESDNKQNSNETGKKIKIEKFFNKFLFFIDNSNEEILLNNKEIVLKLIFILKKYFYTFDNFSIDEIIENKSNEIEEFLNSFIFLLKNKALLFKEEYLSEELINFDEKLLKKIAKKLIVLLKKTAKEKINFIEHIKIIKTYPNIFYHAVKNNKKTIEIQIPLYKTNSNNYKVIKKETEEHFAFNIYCKEDTDYTGYIIDNIPKKIIFDIIVNKNFFQDKIRISSEKGILKIYLYKRSFFYE